ncbi:bifunctional diaminohydroxyphosphoribosylaminopyrimidine deaminase/5-amino-6-(5-phosphoribosylamino)uracil reductase RibD [Candidatus Woesearchaeota archaeon]|nr:bifunctional diaminohydroxyphosphoribosylaminopyrimidine deaminase/5-amino-6-(5-phosphoribosylamino)uracil reductase RibD [Candidatus Woesearchaeota archaeon]
MKTDTFFMRKAIALAEKGVGFVKSNPLVGCVIVKNGRIIAEGYHACYGGDHAEIVALKKVGPQAKGATIYLTLEPCCHTGKTGPCSSALIASGVSRVVVAMQDPNPLVNGRGIEELQRAGIKVDAGLLKEEATVQNEVFVKYILTKLPFVLLKVAVSLDGKLATSCGDSRWITNEEARIHAHYLRRRYDAVLVGIGTVLADNPRLSCRFPEKPHDPLRVVVDSRLNIPSGAAVLSDKNVVIATTAFCNQRKLKQLQDKGYTVIICGKKRLVDLGQLLQWLGSHGVAGVMVEGGTAIHTAFLKEQLADKIAVFVAPLLLGGDKSFVGNLEIKRVADAIPLTPLQFQRFGDNILLEAYLPHRAKEKKQKIKKAIKCQRPVHGSYS